MTTEEDLSRADLLRLCSAIQNTLIEQSREMGLTLTIHQVGNLFAILAGNAYSQGGEASEVDILKVAIPQLLAGMAQQENRPPLC